MKKGLGKGLSALITENNTDEERVYLEIDVLEVEPHTGQPRKHFDEEKLEELAESIRLHGLVQPIIVRKDHGVYRIIAGERRWRASKLAGLKTIPVVIKDVSDTQSMEMALIENIQRQDLNPLEEAEAYHRLMTEHGLTQEKLAERLGKSRSNIANMLRLLGLSDYIKEQLIHETLTYGHARALLPLSAEEQKMMAEKIIEEELSVREVEKMVQMMLSPEEKTSKREKTQTDKEVQLAISELCQRLQSRMGTKVSIKHKNGKGSITIDYYSHDELDRIIHYLEN